MILGLESIWLIVGALLLKLVSLRRKRNKQGRKEKLVKSRKNKIILIINCNKIIWISILINSKIKIKRMLVLMHILKNKLISKINSSSNSRSRILMMILYRSKYKIKIKYKMILKLKTKSTRNYLKDWDLI